MARNNILIRINGNAENFKRTIDGIKKETRTLESNLKSIAKSSAIAFAGLGAGIAGAVSQAAKFEQINTQFEVLIGNAQDSKKALEELKDFSASTPFQFEEIAKAGQQLLGFGFAADELRPKLEEIGNVAAAVGKPIDEIGLIFGQVSAAGKLTGERLLQFQERAIPIGPAIAKTLGVSESAVKKLVSEGAVSFATFEKAFASLSQKGGVAFGALDKQSQTVSGQFSTLKDNVSLLVADFGQQFFPAVRAVTQGLTAFIQILRENKELVKYGAAVVGVSTALAGLVTTLAVAGIGLIKFKVAIAAAAAVSPAFAAGLTAIQVAATAAGTALKFLFANPLGLAITALALGASTAYAFRREISAGLGAAGDVVKEFAENASKNLDGFRKILQGIATFNFALAKEGFQELFDLSGQGTQAADTFAKGYAERMAAFKDEEENRLDEMKDLRLEKKGEENEALLEQEAEHRAALADQKAELDANADQIEADRQKAQEVLKGKLDKKELKEQKKQDKQKMKLDQEYANAKIDIANATANLVTSVAGRESKIAFLISKGAAIAQSIIATNLAAAQALATPPGPPVTFPLAAQAKIAGGLNTAAIVATTFQAQKGFAGSGSPFGESLVSTFTPREIVVPERFSEGIKKGEFSLQRGGGQAPGGEERVNVEITIADDAIEMIEARLIEREKLGTSLRGT